MSRGRRKGAGEGVGKGEALAPAVQQNGAEMADPSKQPSLSHLGWAHIHSTEGL